MKLELADLQQLADVAVAAALEAGQAIAASRPEQIEHKDAGDSPSSQVVTEVDRRAEGILVRHLTPTLEPFDLALLTEETEDDRARLVADHFWCVDPLDGTLPFVEGLAGYAVSIALVARDGTPLIGVVHDPVTGTTFAALRGGGATRDGLPWSPDRSGRSDALALMSDRSFRARDDHDDVLAAVTAMAADLGLAVEEVPTPAGAVMIALEVLERAPACFFKFPKLSGGGSLWDFAATACIFDEVGAVATDIHGDPLDLNRDDSTFMNHRGVLFATDDQVAAGVRSMFSRRAR